MVGKSGRVTELPGVTAMPTRLSGAVIIESATKAELQRLADKYQLDYGNLCDTLDINEAPRLEHRGDFNYLYLRTANDQTREASHITKPLLIIYNHHVLLVISSNKLLVNNSHSSNLVDDLSQTGTTATALLHVIAQAVNSYDGHIKSQIDTIHSFVKKIQSHRLENEDFINLILLEDQLNNFTSALTPLVPLFNRLQADKELPLTTDDSDLLTDIILATEQSIRLCDANTKRLASIRDAYTTMSNNSLNRIMKTLTIATLLIAAPNMVFSMYGMNIRLPMQHLDISFIVVILLAVIITILVVIWGRRSRLF
ncbi:MAG: magnesium transporter CorA family protein [Candidatus Saccharibacteria bacterium]|nr:magnesium transporter CorA family protein [Candidatus Saccharibacteria bacterium]